MNATSNNQLPQDKDRHLDISSDVNRDKHINFRKAEAALDEGSTQTDKTTEKRQREWREGIEAGKQAHNDALDA